MPWSTWNVMIDVETSVTRTTALPNCTRYQPWDALNCLPTTTSQIARRNCTNIAYSLSSWIRPTRTLRRISSATCVNSRSTFCPVLADVSKNSAPDLVGVVVALICRDHLVRLVTYCERR